jgi:hypothetical protein
MVASVRRANSMWGAAMGVALALLFSSAVAPLTPALAAASAVPSGWRAWSLGDIQLAAPGNWRSLESSGPAPLSFGGDAWYFTLAENPRNVDAGALLNLAWTDDGSIYSAGVEPSQIIGSREVDFAGLPADRVEFAVRDAFNNTAGFDIVPQSPIAGRSLTLTCRAPQAKWPAVKPICEGIVASLALALPASAPPDSSSTVATPTPAPSSAAAEPDSQPSVASAEAPSTPIRRAEAQNTDAVVNGPKVATAFTIKTPIFLRALSTYHWNDGRGAAPGTMSLIDSNGTKFGPWQARGASGQGGAPNVTWAAEIRQRMEPGRYTLSTSSDQTWSTNDKAGWKGFYALEYQTYPEVAQPTPQPTATATVATTSTPTAEAGSRKLFSGSLDAWLPLETDGGNFKSFARLENGALIVDVPVNSSWGKTGIRSKEPMVRFDRNATAEAQLTFRLDPQRTTSFVAAVGASDTAQEWSGHDARLAWMRADDGASAELTLWLRGAVAMTAKLGPQAPETLTMRITPDGVVSVAAPNGQRLETIISLESIAAGLRIYALAHAPAANKPAQMALLGISLKRAPWTAKETPTGVAGEEALFDGALGTRFVALETDGGNFKSFARLADGALIVDVPANHGWGKTGIRSKAPMVRFDRNAPAEAQLTFRFDPQRTTSVVLAVGASDTAQEWNGHDARVAWIRAEDGASAELTLWLRGAVAMKAKLGPQAPEALTLRITPDGVVSVAAPDGQRLEGLIPSESIDAGLRIYALAHAPAADKPAQMALLGIALKQAPWAAKEDQIGVARNEILFDGALGTRFVAHSASGGNFVEHARLGRDGLIVDVPKDSNWGKVGVRTPEPAFWLDRWGEGASVDLVYRFDPARTTGFVIVLSAPAAAPGADPDYPALVLHWRRNAEGGGARAALYLFDQSRDPVWDAQLLDPAPAELRISLRPEGVQVLGEGLPATIARWTALREGLGFRAWVYAQPDRAGLPVKMALRSIALAQRLGEPPAVAPPAPGVALLPVKTRFDGRNAPAWEPIGVAGGDFARFAKWGDGRLVVQTPEKASWAKTGLLSAAPVAPLDARLYQTPYRLTVQIDPKETSGFAVAIGPSKAPDMWPTDRLWTSLIRGVDGRWVLSIDRGGNRRWSRVVPRAFVEAEWDGRVVFDLDRNWTTVRLGEGGPLLSASTGFDVGQNLFMSIVSHPPLENLAARLTLKAVSGGWATPGGMTAAQRWPLLDDDAFDPAAFLNELSAGATRETSADAEAAKISGTDAAGYLDAPTLRVAPTPAPTATPQKSGSLLEWLSPIGAAYGQTAAPDCAKAIADQVDAARHIQITLGEQADLKGKLADLGLTLLGKTKLEEGTWREAIRSAADRSVNAWQDGQAIGEDWNQDHTQDMVIHFMQAAMKIGVSSGELGDDSVAREVQHKLRQAWVNAVQKMPEPQARALIAQLSATMKTHSSQDLYKELLDKGKDIDFGAAFGQGAEGENKAMLWTLTNTTLASFIPEYAIGREVASLAVESGKAAQNFVVNQQVRSMYEIWKDQIAKNGGQGAKDFETALTIQGYSSVLQTAKPLIRAAKGLKDDQGIPDDQAKTYLFGLFEKWRQADDTAGKQADGLSKASAAFAKTTCRAELESEVSPKGAACEKELQLFKRYADLDAQVRGRVNAWMRPGNACNAPAAIDAQTGALVCQLLRYGEDAYKTSLGKYLEGCGLLDYAKDRNNAAKRVLDRLPTLTSDKLKALFDRAGVKPTDAFYGCLCPNGHHLYSGPDGGPCRRIGPLGGVSFAGYDPSAWAACAAANRLPDGRSVVDAVADTLMGIHIDQK